MKKFIISLLLLLFSIVCFCQNNENNYLQGYIEQSGTFEKNVPLVKNERSYPIIEVEISDKKYHFLFDTGAMMTIISDKIADSNKLKKENKINISGVAANDKEAKQTEVYVIAENIKISNLQFNNISSAVVDLELLNKHLCTKIDGILGMNLIKLCNWKIDTFGQTVSFSDRVFDDISKDKISLKYHQGLLPLVDISQGKNKFMTLLDTGFDGTLQLFTDFKTTKKMKSRTGEGYYTLGINEMESGKMDEVVLDKISLGNFEIQNVTAYVLNDKPLIGMGILKEYTTILNFSENNMILVSKNKQPDIDITKDFGAKFCINENDELQVCFIWDNSQLKKEGIKVGDRITAINSNPVSKVTNGQYCDFNKIQRENNTVTLTFETHNGLKTIELVK